MNASVASEVFAKGATAIAPSHSIHQDNQTFQNRPSVPNHFEGQTMGHSLVHTTAFNRGEQNSNRRNQSDTRECSDWLQHQLRKVPAKEISAECGIGVRAAEGIKAGRNGLTMAHLVTMCRTNEDFRAQFFAFCGGRLEGDPALVANLSRAINAVMQQQAKEAAT